MSPLQTQTWKSGKPQTPKTTRESVVFTSVQFGARLQNRNLINLRKPFTALVLFASEAKPLDPDARATAPLDFLPGRDHGWPAARPICWRLPAGTSGASSSPPANPRSSGSGRRSGSGLKLLVPVVCRHLEMSHLCQLLFGPQELQNGGIDFVSFAHLGQWPSWVLWFLGAQRR